MKLDRFYPIFDHPDWLRRALPLGVRFVQLRVKDRPETETRAMIAKAQALCRAAGAVLVVNDHWRLAIDAGLGLPSHAAQAMEMGFDAVLLNTAVAKAGDPAAMAEGFARALEAGRLAFEADPMDPRDMAGPPTPVIGMAVLA